jgi:hypothetical protein
MLYHMEMEDYHRLYNSFEGMRGDDTTNHKGYPQNLLESGAPWF